MTRKQEAKQTFNRIMKVYKKYGIDIKAGRKDYATKSFLGNVLIASL